MAGSLASAMETQSSAHTHMLSESRVYFQSRSSLVLVECKMFCALYSCRRCWWWIRRNDSHQIRRCMIHISTKNLFLVWSLYHQLTFCLPCMSVCVYVFVCLHVFLLLCMDLEVESVSSRGGANMTWMEVVDKRFVKYGFKQGRWNGLY